MTSRYYSTRSNGPLSSKEAVSLSDVQYAPTRSLTIRDSKIHGRGLFARNGGIRAKRVVGIYEGVPVSEAAAAQGYDMRYVCMTSRGMIDAKPLSCNMKYINHAKGSLSNVITRELYADGRIFVITARRIRAEEELLLDYGVDYIYTHNME